MYVFLQQQQVPLQRTLSLCIPLSFVDGCYFYCCSIECNNSLYCCKVKLYVWVSVCVYVFLHVYVCVYVHIIAVVCILIAVTKSALLAIVIVFCMHICIIVVGVVVVAVCCCACRYSLLFNAITFIVGVFSSCCYCWRFFKIVAVSFCQFCCCFRFFFCIFSLALLLTTALLPVHSHACLFHLLLCFTRCLFLLLFSPPFSVLFRFRFCNFCFFHS